MTINTPYPFRDGQPQIIRRPRCRVCGTTNVTCEHSRTDKRSGRTTRYYKCNECLDLITKKPTRFKVQVI